MDKITIEKIDWYTIDGFMKKYQIKSNKTVYNLLKKGLIEKSIFFGRTFFRSLKTNLKKYYRGEKINPNLELIKTFYQKDKNFNKLKAAKILSISRMQVYRLLKQIK